MKECCICHEVKVDEEFRYKNKKKNTRQAACKICSRLRDKEYYIKNPSYKKRIRERDKKTTFENKEKFKALKQTLSCEICGENTPCCLQFHHIDPSQKDINVSDAISNYGWERIIKEIEKCVVLCANCHSKVHAGLIKLQGVGKSSQSVTFGK